MKVEFVGGGPWDGRIEPVSTAEIRVPVAPAPGAAYHRYRRAIATCEEGCCSEVVMEYVGLVQPKRRST